MIKRIFIPLSASEQSVGELLELYSRPRLFSMDDIFLGLQHSELEPAIAKANKLMRLFRLKTGYGRIFSNSTQGTLINPESTTLGLLLIATMNRINCPISTAIVSADINNQGELIFVCNHDNTWEQRLAAIYSLGKQSDEVPLILAKGHYLTMKDSQQLRQNNIMPYKITDIHQAIELLVP